jgi:hypothetical protein
MTAQPVRQPREVFVARVDDMTDGDRRIVMAHNLEIGMFRVDGAFHGTFEAIRAETQLLYASDWPHWDFDAPARLFDLPFLVDRSKRNILGYNAARLFNLDIPARYRQPGSVAAE